MKKHYFLTFISLIVCNLSFGQLNRADITSYPPDDNAEKHDNNESIEKDLLKRKSLRNKAFGDTLYYEDFADSLPSGWSIVNNNSNNFQWTWDTIYQQGQFSGTRTRIKSTTASNGFMSLPSDFYNTPTPTTGRVNMDTYFESDTITISPRNSVWVSYQQYVRYCCNSSNRLVLQVSTDNFATLTEFDAIDGLAVNTGNTNNATGGETNQINISSAVAGQSQFKIRFLAVHSGRYFWMIDDFAVIEGVENDLMISDQYMEFNETNYTYYPFYGQIPYDLFPPLPLFARIFNNGSNTLTNVRLEASITHQSFPGGPNGSGNGLVYATSMNTNPSSAVSGSISDSTIPVLTGLPRFVPQVLGNFQVDFLATSDSIDQNLGNETARLFFSTSDTVYARDDNGFGGGTGPESYTRNGSSGGTAVGDRFGTMYIVESNTGNGVHLAPTSVTFRVSGDTNNIGIEIVPKIWEYDEDSLRINGANFSVDRAFGNEVASRFIPYTVSQADLNSFLTISFDNGSALTTGLDSGQYVVGWETTNVGNNIYFEVLNDGSSAALQANVTSFNYHGHAPGWGWVDVNPGIRLNMANLPVSTGLEHSALTSTTFEISPNPTNGRLSVQLYSSTQKTFQLEVKNSIGQTIRNQTITVNGDFSATLDLSYLEGGLYFVSIENNEERAVKKLIVK